MTSDIWIFVGGFASGIGLMLLYVHKKGAANAQAIADGIAAGIAKAKSRS